MVAMAAAVSNSLVRATPLRNEFRREWPQGQTAAALVVVVEPESRRSRRAVALAGRSRVRGVRSSVVARVSATTGVNGSASDAAERGESFVLLQIISILVEKWNFAPILEMCQRVALVEALNSLIWSELGFTFSRFE